MTLPIELERLHQAAREAAREFDTSVEAVFDPCGLILEIPPARVDYWCTPRNVVTFASTGGDGVHYSYLAHPEFANGKKPIVMSLPCSDVGNVIVADSFSEFFNLGYFAGWFSLEQLTYQPNQAVIDLSSDDEELYRYAGARLEFIRQAMSIRPVPPDLERLAILKQSYFHLLDIPDLPE